MFEANVLRVCKYQIYIKVVLIIDFKIYNKMFLTLKECHSGF